MTDTNKTVAEQEAHAGETGTTGRPEEGAPKPSKYSEAERALFNPPKLTPAIIAEAIDAAKEKLAGHGALKITLLVVQQRNEEAIASGCDQRYSEEAFALGECPTLGDLNRGTAGVARQVILDEMPPAMRALVEVITGRRTRG